VDLDWSTFRFQQITFGEVASDVPDGRLHYETDVTVSYDDYPVHVISDFDVETGFVTWEMYSYDEMTGAAPRDPLAGFLPVNNELRQGEDFVTFTVQPRADLPTGTEIHNEAEIVFDSNEAIVTNETNNTIDSGRPESAVHALPADSHNISIPVAWSGTDDSGQGSGISYFDVYVSVDGGDFELWLSATTVESAAYT
jgi:hypothetical protein